MLNALLIFLIVSAVWRRRRSRPGITSATYLLLYGATRFGWEFFRDAPAGWSRSRALVFTMDVSRLRPGRGHYLVPAAARAPRNDPRREGRDTLRSRLFVVHAGLFLAVGRAANGFTQAPAAAEPSATLVTVGGGSSFLSWFGHTALIMRDASSAEHLFDYGIVHPGAAHTRGLLRGVVTAYPAMRNPAGRLATWSDAGRSIDFQRLALTSFQYHELLKRLLADVTPEPHGYRYEPLTDNCTIRIRDLLDGATGGALRRAGPNSSRRTWPMRKEIAPRRRLAARSPSTPTR